MGSTNPASKSSENDHEEFRVTLVRRGLEYRKKFCPKCFGEVTKISPLGGWLAPEDYGCSRCGYNGPVALEAIDDE